MSAIDTEFEMLVVRGGAAALQESTAAPAGASVLHHYGPNVEILRHEPAGMPDMDTGAVVQESTGALPAGLSEGEKLGIAAFRLRQSPAYLAAKAARPRDGEPWEESGCKPPPGPGEREVVVGGIDPSEAAPLAVGQEAVSATGATPMLVGSVAVAVVLVNGPTAATQFTAAERTKVIAEVQAGLTWLGNQDPASNVSWHYEIRDVSITTATNATAASDEERWRNPVMASLGHTQNWQGVVDYAQAVRRRLNTRWAYIVYFVKGYPLWHFGYASSPRIVMDYANNGWGPDNIDRVFAHETGHIFSAPDEYSAANCSCTTKHGVYNEPNGNCASCAPGGGILCIMKNNDWAMCSHTRRHFGWGLTAARAPIGAPVHAVSRSRDKLDIFFTDNNGNTMSAAWQPSMPNWWQGYWHIQGGRAAPGAPVTCVSRSADRLDIFVTGTNGGIYTAAWSPSTGWGGWWRIGTITAPARTPVNVVSRSRDKLDIFITDSAGRVMTSAWEPGLSSWRAWRQIRGGAAAPGAPVTCVSRAADKLDIFVVGTDGRAYTAAWEPNGQDWRGWWVIGTTRFPARAPLNAVSRSRDKLDIFGVENGGATMTAAWQPGFTQWGGWWHIKGGRAQPGSPIHCTTRSADKLDIWVAGTDGGTYTAAWQPGFTQWWGWARLNGGRTAIGGAVTGISRAPDKLDAWTVGMDGRIWTAAWTPQNVNWWAGWWPMGS